MCETSDQPETLCDIHFLSLLWLKVRIEIREQNKISPKGLCNFLRRGNKELFIFYTYSHEKTSYSIIPNFVDCFNLLMFFDRAKTG